MKDVYLGRQPIVDRKQKLVAFELLFRGSVTGPAEVGDGKAASAQVMVNACCDLGLQKVLGGRLGFMNFESELLLSDLVELLPPRQVVIELLESVTFDAQTVARCKALKAAGFLLAVDDAFELREGLAAALPFVDFVKVDVLELRKDQLRDFVKVLRRWPLKLVAEKVETRQSASDCVDLGFDLFQGYFFSMPEVLAGRRPDQSKLALLRMLVLILGDAELYEIEEEIKLQPNLAFNLIRIVNSAAGGLQIRIGSVRQALLVLGRRQLRRWIQVLLYTAGQGGSGSDNALLHLAATRGRLMEKLATLENAADAGYQDRAFMTGILSLLDALLEWPLHDIVEKLNLDESVRDALLYRNGCLGDLLKLVEKKERGQRQEIAVALEYIPFLDMEKLITADAEAAAWASRLSEEGSV